MVRQEKRACAHLCLTTRESSYNSHLSNIVDLFYLLLTAPGMQRTATRGTRAHPHHFGKGGPHPRLVPPKVRVERVLEAENPRGLVAESLRQRQVEELLPQPLVPPMPPPDEEEDDHGEYVEHEQEAGTDADGEIFTLGQPFPAAPALRLLVRFQNFSWTLDWRLKSGLRGSMSFCVDPDTIFLFDGCGSWFRILKS